MKITWFVKAYLHRTEETLFDVVEMHVIAETRDQALERCRELYPVPTEGGYMIMSVSEEQRG